MNGPATLVAKARPICAGHAADPSARVSLRLARRARSERTYQAEHWRGEDDVPWE